MSKKKIGTGGLVFSTNPEVMREESIDLPETLAPQQQYLKVLLDKKQRAGKVVTLIDGFIGKQADLDDLGKMLKTKCGTGGSVKDGQVLIQGDYKNKVLEILTKLNYHVKS